MDSGTVKKKRVKQHGHTQWRVPTAPVPVKKAKLDTGEKPMDELKAAVAIAHAKAPSKPSVPAVHDVPLDTRPVARPDSEPSGKRAAPADSASADACGGV